MLNPRFPPYSPGSRRLWEFYEAGDEQLLADEVRRTREASDAKVAKGQRTPAEAAVWAAIAADVDLHAAAARLVDQHRECPPIAAELARFRAENGIAWETKVQALRREIELRRSTYAGDVEVGRLAPDQARSQLERLEAVHDCYWSQGYAFDGTRDEMRAMIGPILDYAVELQGPALVKAVAA
jgi:hypothetical protein